MKQRCQHLFARSPAFNFVSTRVSYNIESCAHADGCVPNTGSSASEDTTIKIWCTNTATCVLTLRGHSKEVTTVVAMAQSNSRKLISGGADLTVKVRYCKALAQRALVPDLALALARARALSAFAPGPIAKGLVLALPLTQAFASIHIPCI